MPDQRRLVALIFILFLFSKNNSCYSQTIVKQENQNEKNFLVRTKQFNEFIDRFNYKVNFYGDSADSDFKSKIPRDKLINSLFDLKDPRVDPNNERYSKKYVDEKTEFISEVILKNLSINKHSGKIIAEARSRVLLKGTPHVISIFLSQEVSGNNTVKWVINDVKGDLFDFFKSDTSLVRFIPPSSNETDFINLKRALDDTDHLQYYSSGDYRPDYLSVFFYMINSKLIQFEYTEEIIYHIIDIPGWFIKVMEFNRNDMNSGWLINDIGKNTLEKSTYLKNN
jgi:hypothetical protein